MIWGYHYFWKHPGNYTIHGSYGESSLNVFFRLKLSDEFVRWTKKFRGTKAKSESQRRVDVMGIFVIHPQGPQQWNSNDPQITKINILIASRGKTQFEYPWSINRDARCIVYLYILSKYNYIYYTNQLNLGKNIPYIFSIWVFKTIDLLHFPRVSMVFSKSPFQAPQQNTLPPLHIWDIKAWRFLAPVTQGLDGKSHKRRFRLGFPGLKMVHNPGGDWQPGWGVVPNDIDANPYHPIMHSICIPYI